MNPIRLKITEGMRTLMDYPKLAGPVPRIMVLESQYWLDSACMNAAHAMGWELAHAPVALEGEMPREMIAQFIQTLLEFRPDFVLSINLSGMDENGLFAGLFADLRVPYVTWFVDDPRTILMNRTIYASDYAIALTWEAAYADYLTKTGFAETHVMPLAVDPSLFNAASSEVWDHPPSFVGNSMVDFSEREGVRIKNHPRLNAVVNEAFEADRVTRENFSKGLAAILGDLTNFDAEEQRAAELYFFIEGTRRLRHKIMAGLTPEGVVARGDDAWRQVTPLFGPQVNYRLELPDFYRRCEVNLNITSIQMASAANQRVFDCPAAGGFLLTDAQSSLEMLFDVEREITQYHSLEECVDLLHYYRNHPSARMEKTSRAREHILQEHTYTHRLQRIAEIVRNRFS
ncbi:MAG TPA: glycosyltransferase [Candidatus Hydrogenedentes bacterium]|nr:glycosyltransferase [Candidatus Hydrogenedentota bacterium]